MPKLNLVANPTFEKSVEIPMPDGSFSSVLMKFKHRTKTDIANFIDSRKGVDDVDSFFEMVVGWDLDAEMTKENALTFLENYPTAAFVIFRTYVDSLMSARLKN